MSIHDAGEQEAIAMTPVDIRSLPNGSIDHLYANGTRLISPPAAAQGKTFKSFQELEECILK